MSGVDGVNGINNSPYPYIDEKIIITGDEDISVFQNNDDEEIVGDDLEISAAVAPSEVSVISPVSDRNFLETGVSLPVRAFSGVDDGTVGGYLWKQNYLFSKALVSYYNGVNEAADYANEVYANKQEGYIFKQSDLPEEQQRQARQDAVNLLRTRLEQTRANRPDYGDCEEYYNYGSIADWIFTHPVTLTLDKIFGEDSDYHKFLYGTLAPDGMFSTINIGYYAAAALDDKLSAEAALLDELNSNIKNPEEYVNSCYLRIQETLSSLDMSYIQSVIEVMQSVGFGDSDPNSDIREDNPYDFLRIRSVYNIDTDLEAKFALLNELEANIDNPEEFSYLFYRITDGKNFSADEISAYINAVDNGEDTKPLDVILGRNYLEEDYAKNRIGTTAFFSINKTVGTNLLRRVPGGEFLAFGINMGLDYFNETTKDNPDLSAGHIAKWVGAEALRSFPIKINGHGFFSFLSQRGAITANNFGTEPALNTYADFTSDSNVREKLETGSYVLGALDYANSLGTPSGQTSLIIDGYTTATNLSEDIDSGNIPLIIYDSQQVIANPIAQISISTVGAEKAGAKAASGENLNLSDYALIALNPLGALIGASDNVKYTTYTVPQEQIDYWNAWLVHPTLETSVQYRENHPQIKVPIANTTVN